VTLIDLFLVDLKDCSARVFRPEVSLQGHPAQALETLEIYLITYFYNIIDQIFNDYNTRHRSSQQNNNNI
jgi:hypothetical protein